MLYARSGAAATSSVSKKKSSILLEVLLARTDRCVNEALVNERCGGTDVHTRPRFGHAFSQGFLLSPLVDVEACPSRTVSGMSLMPGTSLPFVINSTR